MYSKVKTVQANRLHENPTMPYNKAIRSIVHDMNKQSQLIYSLIWMLACLRCYLYKQLYYYWTGQLSVSSYHTNYSCCHSLVTYFEYDHRYVVKFVQSDLFVGN